VSTRSSKFEKSVFKHETSMDWDAVRVFTYVVECGSLSAAGDELGLSTATVGRRVEALDKALGVKLLHKTTAGTEPTAAGLKIYAAASAAADGLYTVERLAASLREGLDAEPVSISCTEPVAADILAPALPALWRHSPEIRLEIEVATANVNLTRRPADLAIRLNRPVEEILVARKLAPISMGLYASAAYLGDRAPQELNLAHEVLLGWSRSYRDLPENRWFAERNLMQAMRMRSSSAHTLFNAAQAGCGIALLPASLAEPAGLVAIPARGIAQRQPYLAFHRDMRKVERIVAVREWVVTAFETLSRTPEK
jgi:DNA-binding transcriptional LysR family regulator